MIRLDLSSRDSIYEFVNEFQKKSVPLHILINNAGGTLLLDFSYKSGG